MSKRTLGLLAMVGAMFSWGPAPVITKLGLSEIPPYSFAFLRFLLALIILLPIFFSLGHHKVARGDLKRFLLVGIFGSGLNVIFFMTGLSRTTATSSAAIFATVPLVNALAAAFILRERPTLVRVLGVIVGLLGSFLIALSPSFLGTKSVGGDVLGNLLVGLAVFSWVAYIIGSKELLQKYSPLTMTTYSFLVGVTVLFPLSYFEFVSHPGWYLKLTALGFWAILYGAIFASVVPFFLYQWGMKQTSAFAAGIVTYLNPVLASLWAIPLLGEYPSPVFLIGTGLILGGVFLATAYELIQKRRQLFLD